MRSNRRHLRQAGLAACAAALAGAAYANHGAPAANYLGLHGGVNNVRGDWGADVSLGTAVTLPGTLSTQRGAHFGVFGGRQTEHARFELEYQQGRFDVTRLQLGPVSQAVDTGGNYRALTANAYRTEPISSRLTLYGALGIGWGRVALPQMAFVSPPCNCFPAASKSGFAWLARAGIEFQVSEGGRAFVQYTHLDLPRAGSGGAPGVSYSRRDAGALTVGWRHTF